MDKGLKLVKNNWQKNHGVHIKGFAVNIQIRSIGMAGIALERQFPLLPGEGGKPILRTGRIKGEPQGIGRAQSGVEQRPVFHSPALSLGEFLAAGIASGFKAHGKIQAEHVPGPDV